ncbi:BlaI/MecI/CopY family transcriptional regulator [Candidatus Woesearchaeota archaeon]|nr:BlaI/MecI/CopY family transcriptional regulator [Candidatus Woesearchaeota archaeon]
MEEEILQNLGFTYAESKVYLLLLALGSVKVGKIIEKSGLQSSTIHNTLNSLADKGYITYVLKGKIRIYQAVNPKNILKELKDKEAKFKSILPFLEQKHKFGEEKPQAEIFEGIKGIINLLNELIEDAKRKDYYYFFAMDESNLNKEIQKFFEMYDVKRKDKGLIIKGIARNELKYLFKRRKALKMKYVSHQIPSNISMCNNKIAIISWGEKPTGILIKSKQICKSQSEFFESLWKTV